MKRIYIVLIGVVLVMVIVGARLADAQAVERFDRDTSRLCAEASESESLSDQNICALRRREAQQKSDAWENRRDWYAYAILAVIALTPIVVFLVPRRAIPADS